MASRTCSRCRATCRALFERYGTAVDAGIWPRKREAADSARPLFGQWELDMLSECYEQVHHVSLHTYYSCKADNPSGSLAQADNMNSFIREVAALCDAAGAAKRSARKLSLSFDEWNVWEPNAAREKWGPAWSVAPSQLEQVYTLLDAKP